MVAELGRFRLAVEQWTETRDTLLVRLSYIFSTLLACAVQAAGELEKPLRLRELNDQVDGKAVLHCNALHWQVMRLERVFLLLDGLPDRPFSRNALFSPAKFNKYGGAAFPGVSDLLYGLAELEAEPRLQRAEQLKKHLSDLMIIFRQAASWLDTDYHL